MSESPPPKGRGAHALQVRPVRKLLRALDLIPRPAKPEHQRAVEEIRYLLRDLADSEAGPEGKIGLRDWLAQDVRAVLEANNITGVVAEIGGSRNGLRTQLPEWGFKFLSLYPGDDPDMVVADVTACPQIPDETFDAVVSVNCFEHIERPWRAAEEITRILKPGGITYHLAPFSYFYHLAPIDHWRYTPEAFAGIFRDLEPIKAEFYGANRRRNNLGSEGNPVDGDGGPAFAPDGFGGWRENWYAVYVGRKTPGWGQQRLERERNQIVVDVCKALEQAGLPAESLPSEAEKALSCLTVTDAGEVGRAVDGVGIGISAESIATIWAARGKLGIKPSFRRYALLAMSGHPAAQ